MSHTGSKLGSGASFDMFEGVSSSMLSSFHFNQYLFAALSSKVIFNFLFNLKPNKLRQD